MMLGFLTRVIIYFNVKYSHLSIMEKAKVIRGFIKAALRPLLRFCVRNSIKIQEFTELSKNLYVEAAEEHLQKSQTEISASRISMMTGVHRRDVNRLRTSGPRVDSNRDLPARVIGQWQTHPDFVTKAGKARVLSFETAESEFAELVRSVSSDVSPYSVLFELERVGAVTKSTRGLKLVSEDYVPKGDTDAGLYFLETDTDDLLSATAENILEGAQPENLHLKTEYTRIDKEKIPLVREWILNEGSAFHRKIRGFLSQFDVDVNPSAKPDNTSRVAVATFSITEDSK